MRKLNLIILAIITGLITASADEIKREFKTSPGKQLTIDLTTGGSIEITGWDQDLISVIARVDGDAEDYQIDFDEGSRGLSIDVTYRGRGRSHNDVLLRIKIPVKYDLDLETMGGEIILNNIEGEIEGETMGGELELTNIKGKIEMTTMGGDITVEDSDLDGEVKTMGGEVLFRDVIGDLRGSSMGGDVVYKNVKRRGEGSPDKEVRISTMGGEISVDEAPGGANVSTMGGDITIRSAGKFVKAKTMGGDIEVREIDGGAKVSTMGGDINVKMTGDPDKGDRDVDISSMGGEIFLTLPEGLSIDFDIKLTVTKRARDSYKIISDFPIEIEESDDWDYSEGSPRRYIFGKGKVGGGKNKIKIDTINGDIHIKKGS